MEIDVDRYIFVIYFSVVARPENIAPELLGLFGSKRGNAEILIYEKHQVMRQVFSRVFSSEMQLMVTVSLRFRCDAKS